MIAGRSRSRFGKTARVRVFRFTRHARKSLLQFDIGDSRTLSDFSRAAVGFMWLTRFFYLIAVYGMITFLRFDNAFKDNPPTDPLWPISLLSSVTDLGWLANVAALSVAGSAVALLAALSPDVLIWRLGVFLYVFLFNALQNSYGSVNHGNYLILYVSFALLFMPSVDDAKRISRKDIVACIKVFWLTQSLILFPYSLSGFMKIWHSNLGLLASDGMVRTLLNRAMSDTENIPLLLPFIVEHEYLAQMVLLGTVYVQFFALLALFRPHLHRPFGTMLILFHLGSVWLMNISFSRNVLMVGLFLLLSPLAPSRFSLTGLLQSLPLIGIPFRAWARLQARQTLPVVASKGSIDAVG